MYLSFNALNLTIKTTEQKTSAKHQGTLNILIFMDFFFNRPF